MKLGTYTGSLLYEDIQVETSVAKLGFRITTTDVARTLAGMYIKADVAGREGSKMLIPTLKVYSLMQICSMLEGSISIIETSTDVFTIEGTIDVGTDGALKLDPNKYLSVVLTAAHTSDSIELYSIDMPAFSLEAFLFDPITFNGGGVKEVDLRNASAIIVPVDAVASINIDFEGLRDGQAARSIIYTRGELKLVNRDTNDIVVSSPDSTYVKYGYHEFLVLPLQAASRAKVEALITSTFNIYIQREIAI